MDRKNNTTQFKPRKFRVKTGVLLHPCPTCGAKAQDRCTSLKRLQKVTFNGSKALPNIPRVAVTRVRSHASRRRLTFGDGA